MHSPFDNIQVPHTYEDMIRGAKKYKKTLNERLVNHSKQQLESYSNYVINFLESFRNTNDSQVAAKTCYVVYSIYKFSNNNKVFDRILSKFTVERSPQVHIFITYIIAKLCEEGDSAFSRAKLAFYHQKIYNSSDVLGPAHFLVFLAKYNPKSILMNLVMFLDCIKTIIAKKQDMLQTCRDALENFVAYLSNKSDTVKETPINMMYETFKSCIGIDQIDTSFGILSVLLNHKFIYPFIKPYASDILTISHNLSTLRTLKCHDLILWCLAYASKLDIELFQKKCLKSFSSQLFSLITVKNITPLLADCYVKTIRVFPELLVKRGMENFNALTAMLWGSGTKQGYILIEEMIKNKKFTAILNQNMHRITSTLAIATVNDNYIEYIPTIFSKLPSLWEQYKASFVKQMINLLKKENLYALKVLAKCPPINNPTLLSILKNLISCPNDEIRSSAPAAYLRNAQYIDSKELAETTEYLLTSCMCEASPKVRYAIITSFKPTMYRYLSAFDSLRNLEILVNDDDIDVKIATLSLLVNLCDITPLSVEPILRHTILDTMYILKTPGSHTLRAEASKVLDYIAISKTLIPIYIDDIMNIILSFFEMPLISSMSYFEKESYFEISQHFAKFIAKIAKQDFSLIRSYAVRAIKASTRILRDSRRKDLKIIVIESLTVVISKMDQDIEFDKRALAEDLVSITSKWNSRKLNMALLEVLGLIGAISKNKSAQPRKVKHNSGIDTDDFISDRQSYYLRVVCNSLLNVLNDHSLAADHCAVAKILVLIFCTKDQSLYEAFERFIPIFIDMIREKRHFELMNYLERLCIQAPSAWLIQFSDEVIGLIYELWPTIALNDTLSIIPALAAALCDKFSPFLPQCISLLLDCLQSNRTTNADISFKVINTLLALRKLSSDYIFLIIPDLTATATYSTSLKKVRVAALVGLRVIVQTVQIKQYASEIIRCIISTFKSKDQVLIDAAIQLLYSLQYALGKDFDTYINQMSTILGDLRISAHYFNELNEENKKPIRRRLDDIKFITQDDPSKVLVVPDNIGMDISFITSKLFNDCMYSAEGEYPWKRKEWFRRFVSSVIKYSPVMCIALAAPIAEHIQQLTDALFNIGFLSCWERLDEKETEKMRDIISQAIVSNSLSNSAKSTLISLIEFMDRAEVPIGIPDQQLCEICKSTGHYAKAYYFATKWLAKENSLQAKDALVFIASNLDLKENVVGLVNSLGHGEIPPIWYEYLGEWDHALEGYQKEHDEEGIVRCQCNMMDYAKVAEQCDKIIERKGSMKPLITALHFQGDHQKVIQLSQDFQPEGSFTRILTCASALILGKKDLAIKMAQDALNHLATQAGSKFKQDRFSLSKTIVYAMAIDEIIEQAKGVVDKRQWAERLRYSQFSYQEFKTIFDIRRNLLTDEEICEYNAKLISCTRISHDWNAFDSFISQMPEEMRMKPEIKYAVARGEWERGNKENAIKMLKEIDITNAIMHTKTHVLYYIGHYTIRTPPPGEVYKVIDDAVVYLKKAIALKSNYYKAIHRLSWGLSTLWNADKTRVDAVTEAVLGFIECVKLRPYSSCGDLLQMIHIVFKTKLSNEVFMKVKACFNTLESNYLLFIIPQLFAQLTNENSVCSSLAIEIITTLLPHHFHSLLYPLYQMIREDSTTNISGKAIAASIIQKFQSINHVAAEQAKMVSDGLFSASYSCFERWLMVLPTIGKYIEQGDIENAAKVFMPVYKELLQQTTPDAARFAAIFRPERLDKCYKLFTSDGTLGADRRASRLRDHIRNITTTVKLHIDNIRAYKLSDLSPALGAKRGFVLAIPGTVSDNKELITIDYFDPLLEVISSKQHPRVVIIHGSDGKPHKSLLKGHEDLRLDQRVMQFFTLMNVHIRNGANTRMRDLEMHCYAITPISVRSGLIQFIDDTDTIYSLINNYRKQHKVKTQDEYQRMISESTQDIDKLTRMQRMELIDIVSAETSDSDLANAIWIKSPNSVEWIRRTTRFAKTTGVMSIIGYIIGLGDRHPSNIMIHKYSGDVIHIDFSDCFEIARAREMFPEYIPFRLTRMMIYAFGASGIEGNFRIACEETMKLVRSHRESIMTVLDIFLQVPIESEDDYDNLDIKKSIDRIGEKIVGKDFNDKTEKSVEDQVSALISEATDSYNLASLYHGWTPLW